MRVQSHEAGVGLDMGATITNMRNTLFLRTFKQHKEAHLPSFGPIITHALTVTR